MLESVRMVIVGKLGGDSEEHQDGDSEDHKGGDCRKG